MKARDLDLFSIARVFPVVAGRRVLPKSTRKLPCSFMASFGDARFPIDNRFLPVDLLGPRSTWPSSLLCRGLPRSHPRSRQACVNKARNHPTPGNHSWQEASYAGIRVLLALVASRW